MSPDKAQEMVETGNETINLLSETTEMALDRLHFA